MKAAPRDSFDLGAEQGAAAVTRKFLLFLPDTSKELQIEASGGRETLGTKLVIL